jgi:hypothetical protein
LWCIVAFVLLFVIGFGVRVWVVSRINAVEKVEQTVRSIVELELKSINDGDIDLFRTIQDPIDATWQERQVNRYFSQSAAQFAPAPGLTPAERPWDIRQVRILGRTARVELVRWFHKRTALPVQLQAELADGPSIGLLPFHITWHYGVDPNGAWHHITPPDEFLGVPHAWHGTRLDIRATQIEADALNPAAPDLASLVSQACRWLDCPRDARFSLSFEDGLVPQIQAYRWALPTLYLAGIPDSEHARAAWEHGMQLWVLDALAQARVSDEGFPGNTAEVTQRIVFRQLVARLGAEFGLAEPVSPDVGLLTRALRDQQQHPLGDLWKAKFDSADLDESRLFEAEVAALLDLLAENTGPERLFLLLPALRDYNQLGDALLAVFDLDIGNFPAAWSAYLSDLTGTTTVSSQLPASAENDNPSDAQLPPPPVPTAPLVPPGDHIAFICNGRIWAADVDGDNLVPLTTSDERYKHLYWSPDGRWLLTTWQPNVRGGANVLYLLAADGGEGRLLPDDVPAAQVLPLGWSPDGREAIYAMWHKVATFPMEFRAIDVESGESRVLPGLPNWSPDGAYLNYVAESFGSAWLASGDWEDARPIADRAWAAWQAGNWAPDGSRVVLQVDEAERPESTIAIFDLETEHLTPLISSADLTAALRAYQGPYIADGADPSALGTRPLRWMWPFGWSADGSHILVWAHRSDRTAAGRDLSVLGVIPLDGSTPKALAFIRGSTLGSASWSPTHPDRIAFTWLPEYDGDGGPTSFLFDLDTGPIYFGAQSRSAAWSPDGAWVALNGTDEVVIVDQEGHEHYTLKPRGSDSCSNVVWNPAADLRFCIPTAERR